MVDRVQPVKKAPTNVPGARRAQLMPGDGGASFSANADAMQSGANPVMMQSLMSRTPGDTASQVRGDPNTQGDRGAAAIPVPGQGPSRYNQAAGPVPPTYVSDVDISQNIWSPFQPVVPFGPPYVNYPRTYDYPVGLNLDFTSQGRLTFFKLLQVMSRSWGILRTVIETRKDQLMRIPWDVQLKDKPKGTDPRLTELRAFLKYPDKQNTFNQWMRLQLEDLFVTDTANYYVWKDRGGKPFALMHVAGETIKPLIDDAGRRPMYPNPAWQQLIKGLPWQNLDESEFVYAPMRPTPQEPIYGYSPVQQIYIEILQGIKKMLYKLSYWEDGTIPQMIITVPAGWTPEQLAAFQAHMDVMLAGNIPFKSRIRFMPSESKPFDLKNANGELLKTEEDEWLTRLVCYAFSVPSQPFMRQMNRATAESAAEEAEEEGLHPTMTWVKECLMDPIIQNPGLGFGYDDVEFVWQPEAEVDTQKQMTVITGYVKEGIMTPDEGRDQINLPPLPDGAGAEAIVISAQGPVPLKETVEANKAKALAVPDQLNNQQEAHDMFMTSQANPQSSAPPAKPGKANGKANAKNGKGNGKQALAKFWSDEAREASAQARQRAAASRENLHAAMGRKDYVAADLHANAIAAYERAAENWDKGKDEKGQSFALQGDRNAAAAAHHESRNKFVDAEVGELSRTPFRSGSHVRFGKGRSKEYGWKALAEARTHQYGSPRSPTDSE
jgi:portal protein